MKLQRFPQITKMAMAIIPAFLLLQCDLIGSSVSETNPGTNRSASQNPQNNKDNKTKDGELNMEHPSEMMPSAGDEWNESCFWGEDASEKEWPLVKIFTRENTLNGSEVIDITIVFNRYFVDNTYGVNSIGWSHKRGHRFSDLYKSDHTELLLTNSAGDSVFHGKIDLLSPDPNAASGYSSLGVTGGDGTVLIGNSSDIVGYTTSLNDNINLHGYHLFQDSPVTDNDFTPNPKYPEWNYYVTYSISVKKESFGTAGFGNAEMTYVHASPSKMAGSETIIVYEQQCPQTPNGPDDPGGLPPEIPDGTPPDTSTPPDDYEPTVPG